MLKHKKLAAAITLLAVTSTGCATRTEYQLAPLPLPPRPELPNIPADDLACLSDRTYDALAQRDKARRQYADELEVIIKTSHLEYLDGR